MLTDWYIDSHLDRHASLGSRGPRPGSLAGLHEARKANLAQYFTPEPIANFIWNLVSPAMDRALGDNTGAKIAILDNSVGTGRLFRFADPGKHFLAGVDIHAVSVNALVPTLEQTGFDCEIRVSGMECIRPRGFGVGLLNPPFSIHLETPLLEPLPCTSWGRFGPNTGADSHEYALHQALRACGIVVAVVARTFAERAMADECLKKRLVAVFHCPSRSFAEEGVDVAVSLLVFDSVSRNHRGIDIEPVALSNWDAQTPDLGLSCQTTRQERPQLNPVQVRDEKPSITLPVTGDPVVAVGHDGRRIILKFRCGLTQAKVMNAVLGEPLARQTFEAHRYPDGMTYTGQGKLDIEVHLLQEDPLASLRNLLNEIRTAGGMPQIDPGLWSYLRRRMRQNAVSRTPLRHTIWVEGAACGPGVTGKAKKTHLAVSGIWGSPVIKAGQAVTFARDGDGYAFTLAGEAFKIPSDELGKRFAIETANEDGETGRWEVKHEGRLAAFPDLALALRKRAARLGIDRWLDWDYQLDDLIETSMGRVGCIVSWEMGLGKGRLAAALCVMGGMKRNLITVDASLVPEIVEELSGLPIPPESWQVIASPGDLACLKTINVISYQKLRQPLCDKHPRRTYARMLRRRIGIMVSDEGDLVKHSNTQQSRALRMVSPKKRFILSGSPLDYPRDILPQLAFTSGDGTALQPYGILRGYLERRHIASTAYMPRGVDAFRDHYVELEWVTNEFAESLQTGAKREIPRIVDLPRYRTMLAPHVKRRLAAEPDVAKFVQIPRHETIVTTLEWDEGHLLHYLTVAEDFVEWYRRAKSAAANGLKAMNLVAILAKLQAVRFACNYPQRPSEFGSHGKLTTKQFYALDRLEELVAGGHKTLLFADSPGNLELLGRELDRRGIDNLVFHGEIPIGKRTKAFKERFRRGDCPVMLASFGVTRRGHNIPEADRVILFNRLWSAREEAQSIARLLRPQQTREVLVERIHIKGSIDEYQAQMCAHKSDAARAGLDYGSPQMADAAYEHLETILGRFCEQLAKLRGCQRHDLRKSLQAA